MYFYYHRYRYRLQTKNIIFLLVFQSMHFFHVSFNIDIKHYCLISTIHTYISGYDEPQDEGPGEGISH